MRPDLPRLETGQLDDFIDAGGAEGLHFVGGGALVELDALELIGCIVEGVSFANIRFRHFDVQDVFFRNCDFAGVILSDRSRLTRVRFGETRGIGFQANGGTFTDVEFVGGNLDLSSFRMAILQRFGMRDLRARELDLYGSKIQTGYLLNCDLTSLELSGAEIQGLALHGSNIERLRGVSQLSGVSISQNQLMLLAGTLASEAGIQVGDDIVDDLIQAVGSADSRIG